MLNLLLYAGYLNYGRLHIYSKTLGQEKYQFLRDWTESLVQFTKKEVASFHSAADDIIPVLFLTLPRSEGWPHCGRTFSIYHYPLSF